MQQWNLRNSQQTNTNYEYSDFYQGTTSKRQIDMGQGMGSRTTRTCTYQLQ